MAAPAVGQQWARPAPSGRGRLARGVRQHFWPYLFISPFFVLFAVFGLFPYLYAFFLSFNEWNGISPMEWVGLENYRRLLSDDVWWKSVYNSVWLMVAASLNLVIALVLAFILNSGLVRFKEAYRTAFFVPVIASSVAVAMIFTTLFGYRYGTLNYLLGFVGVDKIDWLKDPTWIKPAIGLVVVWRAFGWNTVIYLAGLQSIPPDLYEAARVDGAGWTQVFRHITLPLLRPVITFTAILTIIGSLQLFEEPLIIAGGAAYSSASPGGTDQAGLTVIVNLYNTAFNYGKFGYAATMSVALFVLIVVFSFAYNRFFGGDATE
jgi:cellobiose transport system permease protein